MKHMINHVSDAVEEMTTEELISLFTGAKLDDSRNLIKERDLSTLYTTDKRHIETYKGFGPKGAMKLAACLELTRRIMISNRPKNKKISDSVDVWNLLGHEMKFLPHEEFRILILGGRNELLKIVTIATGRRDSCVVHSGQIFREALLEKACAIILVHNHPSGDPSPSPEDCAMTRKVTSAGQLLGVEVLDHIIIGADGHKSLREAGLIN